MKDFFISYTENDVNWATWVAAVLEQHGYSVLIQVWDFRPGEDFVVKMDEAITQCTKCICILSEDYISSAFCKAEWTKVFANDPIGNTRSLIPVRVTDVMPTGLLKTRIFIDLFEKETNAATDALLTGVKDTVPREKPAFPGQMVKNTMFPGNSIHLKYLYNGNKDIIYLIISDQNSLDYWMQKTREEKKLFLYSHFTPKQFLILGSVLYKGSICYEINDENWRILATIEMKHNSYIENARIHIFEEDGMLCSVDSNVKEFNGHIGIYR